MDKIYGNCKGLIGADDTINVSFKYLSNPIVVVVARCQQILVHNIKCFELLFFRKKHPIPCFDYSLNFSKNENIEVIATMCYSNPSTECRMNTSKENLLCTGLIM
jgi:hypothetical protein